MHRTEFIRLCLLINASVDRYTPPGRRYVQVVATGLIEGVDINWSGNLPRSPDVYLYLLHYRLWGVEGSV